MKYASFLLAVSAFAAVEGTVENLTTGKPQQNDVVTLVELGSGMANIGSVRTGPDGKFTFNADLKPGTPYLIQSLHQGVTYNKMLQPGTAAQGIALEVYDVSARAPDAKVTQHMILLEPSGSEVTVNETVIYTNTGRVTYQDPNGTLRVYAPATGPVKLRVTAPQGMPIAREADKGKEENVYLLRYPVKPGETRIDLQYAAAPGAFKGRVLHEGGPVRFVAPKGVKFESAALTDLGPEPRTQATVYELKGKEFAINIQGTGALRESSASSEQPAAASGAEESDTPGIDIVKPRVYQRLPLIVGLALSMLAVGFIMLYRRSA